MKTEIRTYTSAALKERMTCIRHASGLEVFILPKKRKMTSVMLSVPVGSADPGWLENGVRTEILPGAAHFLEHKVFVMPDGTDALLGFSKNGADANAYTGYHHTVFLFNTGEKVCANLALLFRCVLHPGFTDADVDRERGIIQEELRMYRDQPGDYAYNRMLWAMYRSNPVRQDICGDETSIERISAEHLRRLHCRYYHAGLMKLVMAGPVRAADVLAVLDENLSPASPGEPFERISVDEPECAASHRISAFRQTAIPSFVLGIKDTDIPSDPHERLIKSIRMNLVEDMLFSRSGELYNSLLDSGLIMPDLSYGYSIEPTEAHHAVSGESSDPETVLERVRAYVRKTAAGPFDADAFERSRRCAMAGFIKNFDAVEDITGEMLYFAQTGIPLFDYPELLNSVRPQEVEADLKSFWNEDGLVLSEVLPASGKNGQ